MSLLTPEPGLVFWMTISFGIVVLILVKFAFPAILKSVEKRSDYIEDSLTAAKEAHKELADVKKTTEKMIADARLEQNAILKETSKLGDQIIKEAREKASLDSERLVADANEQIRTEKELALRSIRSELSSLSVDLAEKILREKLGSEKEQLDMIDRLLNEIEISKS